MSAFATSGDYYPYYRARRPVAFPRDKWAPQPQPQPQPAVPEQDTRREYPAAPPVKDVPQNTNDAIPQNPQEVNPQEAASEEKPWLTANEKPAEEEAEQPSPPAEEQQPPIEDETSIASVEPEESKKAKKKSFIPNIDIKPPQLDPEQSGDEEEEDDRPSGGNAAASFNAWFPIMLGMFPPSGYGGDSGLGYSGYGAGTGTRPSSFTSVVANSVSHGRNGVASSHAVAYGGGSQQQPLQALTRTEQHQAQPSPLHG